MNIKNDFFKKLLCYVVVISFLFNMFPLGFRNIARAEDGNVSMTIQKSVDKTEVYPGENFTYTIKYANPNLTSDAKDVVINDILPDNIQLVSYEKSNDVKDVIVNGNEVKFVFYNPLKAGSTGFVRITAKFPEGKTLDKINGVVNSANNIASIISSNGSEVISNEVTVIPRLKTPDWSVSKRVIVPFITPAVGQPVTYEIKVNSNSTIGGLDLKNVRVSDIIPENSIYISSNPTGIYDSQNRTVSFLPFDLPVGQTRTFTITVIYPKESFNTSSIVTNNAEALANLYGDNTDNKKITNVSHGFADPIFNTAGFQKTGRQANDRYSIGQTAVFYLSGIKNIGNTPIDKIAIADNIPEEIELTQITTGKYSSDVSLIVKYKTNKYDYRQWGNDYFNSNSNLEVSSLNLEEDEYITNVMWEITNGSNGIPAGFTDISSIRLYGKVSKPLTGNKITNRAVLTASLSGKPDIILNSSKDIYVIDKMPWPVPIKSVIGSNVVQMKESVTYKLTIKNHEFAAGDYINPVAVDVFPQELENINILSYMKNGNQSITPQSLDILGNKYKWSFNDTLKPGEYIDITVAANVKDLTLVGAKTNYLYITTVDQNIFENDNEGIADTLGLNIENGISSSFPNKVFKAQADIFVKFNGSLKTQKWVKGELDDSYGFYGDASKGISYGKTLPGGIADYRLVVENTGSNGPISNIVAIDILPYVGDKGVISSESRGSQWRPYLVNKIICVDENGNPKALPATTKIYYSTNPNPSRVELSNPIGYTPQAGDNWSTTPPDDITTVRALKFEFGSFQLNSMDKLILQWPMRVPLGPSPSDVAWNSFGYSAAYPDFNGLSAFIPSEPMKVGFEVVTDPTNTYAIGNYVWDDLNYDGIQNDGESGINGILVNLYKKIEDEFTLVGYTRTGFDNNNKPGYYSFPDVGNGTYKVEFVYPKDYRATKYNVDDNIEINSKIDGSNNIYPYVDNGVEKYGIKTNEFVINNGDNLNIDAGLYRVASVGDLVWNDKNANGKQDDGTAGITNINVYLYDRDGNIVYDADGKLVEAIKTDSNGKYMFSNLNPGTYKVVFENPSGIYKVTNYKKVGVSEDLNSDGNAELDNLSATALVTLKSGENNLNIDLGLYLAQIGDYVWHDLNANGIQDSTETGISGAKVNIYDENLKPVYNAYGILLNSQTTSSSGKYLFDNLKPKKYILEFILPNGYAKASPKYMGTNTAKDSNIDRTSFKTDLITINPGDRNTTIDAGFYKLAAVGDFVWKDLNGNGIQDKNYLNVVEPGIKGVEVSIENIDGTPVIDGYGNIVNNTSTNDTGYYSFTNLEPGSYRIRFKNIDSSSYKFTIKNAPNSTVSNDSNADSTGLTDIFTLKSGDNNTTIDAGLYRGIIGDFVWHDLNANGIQDSGEVGIGNVLVSLLDEEGNQILNSSGQAVTTYTDSKGYYEFSDLIPYRYRVKFNKPEGYVYSIANVGDDSKDSDGDSYGITGVIDLSISEINKTIDQGVFIPVSIGDYAWIDLNKNGKQDGEPALEGVTVNLYKKGETEPLLSTVTNKDGKYYFNNLVPNEYEIRFIPPKYYYTPTIKGADSLSSKIDALGYIKGITVISGVNNYTYDAGYVLPDPAVDIQKGVYIGHDDGASIDKAAENITAPLGTNITYVFKVTNTGSTYLKDLKITDPNLNITEASMIIKEGKLPLAVGESITYYYETTIKNNILNTADIEAKPIDKYGDDIPYLTNPTDRDSAVVVKIDPSIIIEKTVYPGHDKGAGYLNGGELVIGEDGTYVTYVFKVTNNGSVPLKDIRIDDPVLGITISNMTKLSGNDVLMPGEYAVYFYETSIRGNLNNIAYTEGTPCDNNGIKYEGAEKPSSNNDANVVMHTPNIKIEKTVYGGHDSGLKYLEVSENVSGEKGTKVTYVFKVTNTGDVPLKDILIYDSTLGLEKKDLKKISGNEILLPNESSYYYYESVIDETLNNVAVTSGIPCDEKGNVYELLSKPSDEDDANVTLLSPSISIEKTVYKGHDSGLKYLEGNENVSGEMNVPVTYVFKVTNTGDTPLRDINIKDDILGIDLKDMTKISGSEILMPNEYAIYYYESTITGDLVNTAFVEGSPCDEDGLSYEWAKKVADNDDASVTILSSLGDRVFYDKNGSGLEDKGEEGIQNVKIILRDSMGNTFETTTDKNGYYFFHDLIPGAYTVTIDKETLPKDYFETYELDSSLDGEVSLELYGGDNIDTVDFGYYELASLGDFVWEDTYGDGIQDNGERGIEGIAVSLYSEEGQLIKTTTTDEKGYYLFSELKIGKYYVAFEKPNDYTFTKADEGNDIEKNSKADSEGKTKLIEVKSGDKIRYADAGMYKLAALGNFVWRDSNLNGIQDEGERVVAGVTVNLFSKDGTLIATTTTNSNGIYAFENLIPGEYYLQFIISNNYRFTKTKAGNDIERDSSPDKKGLTELISLKSGEVNNTIDAGLIKVKVDVGDADKPDIPNTGLGSSQLYIGLVLLILSLFMLRKSFTTNRK